MSTRVSPGFDVARWVSPYERHVRPAAEAALFAWLAATLNDWHESSITRPKGSTQAATLIASTVCLLAGVLLAAVAREKLVCAVRARREVDGQMPGPAWIFRRGLALGIVYALCNVPAYFAFMSSHPARVVVSFLAAGAIGGAWLARSVIVREHATRDVAAYAAAPAVLPAAMIGAIVGSAAPILARMHLDGAIGWAFAPIPFCGGVEMGALSVKLVPFTLAFAAALAAIARPARRLVALLAPKRARALGLAALTAAAAWLFATIVTRFVLASPPRACRDTPWRTPVEAMTTLHSHAYAERAIGLGCALGAVAIAIVILTAARRDQVRGPSEDVPGAGPYRG